MLSSLFDSLKISFKPIFKNHTQIERCRKLLANISYVVSKVPHENKYNTNTYMAGQFMIYKSYYEGSSDDYLTFEWIPSEGYHSRFSKRNFVSVNETDKKNCSGRTIHYNSENDDIIRSPNKFWQVFKIYSFWVVQLKLIWTDWENDVGYVIIKDHDFIYKQFKFMFGGLRIVSNILSNLKCRKRCTSIDMYQIIYDFPVNEQIELASLNYRENNSLKKVINIEHYEMFFNEHGQMEDIFNFKKMAFYYGLDESIRKEGWKFLLGYFTYSSTPEERHILSDILKQKYYSVNSERISLSEDDNRRRALKKVESSLDKDVIRTDRTNPFYAGNENKNLKILKNILLNYAYTRPCVGYSQGMSDLLAPLLQVFNDESDTFWCFIGFMENIYCAIFPSNENMDHVMKTFIELTKFMSPEMYSLYSNHEVDVCLIFIHRWYVLCFQREFPPSHVIRVWEACWSTLYCTPGYFQFFIGLAILDLYHIQSSSGSSIFKLSTDEVLLFFTQSYYNFDANIVLERARMLLRKFRKSYSIPCSLKCFIDYRVHGGWSESFKPQIICNCQPINECQFRACNIKSYMSNLLSKVSCDIDIEGIREDLYKTNNFYEDVVFEKNNDFYVKDTN